MKAPTHSSTINFLNKKSNAVFAYKGKVCVCVCKGNHQPRYIYITGTICYTKIIKTCIKGIIVCMYVNLI